MTHQLSDVALDVVGAASPLWGAVDRQPGRREVAASVAVEQGSTIAGGTSEVQRTIIGERLLGLPR